MLISSIYRDELWEIMTVLKLSAPHLQTQCICTLGIEGKACSDLRRASLLLSLLAHIKIDVRLRTITLQTIDGNVNSSGFWNSYLPIDHLNRCTLFIGTILIQNYKCQSSLWLFSCTVFVQWEIVVGFHICSESISKYVYIYILFSVLTLGLAVRYLMLFCL